MDPKMASNLQHTVTPATKNDISGVNPYVTVLSEADEKLQDIELHAVPQKPWGAPVPTREEVSRSLSLPILQSPAAEEARIALSPGHNNTTTTTTTSPSKTKAGSSTTQAPSSTNLLVPVEGETFSAAQIRQLETEVGRLRETVDVLLEARGMKGAGFTGGASSTARAAINAAMAGYRTGGPVRVPSALRVAEPSMAGTGRIHSTADRVQVSLEQHEQHSAMLTDTLRDKKKHDQRIVALQKESQRLRDPHVRTASSTSGYRRINDQTLGIKKVNPRPTPAASLDQPSDLERRMSHTSERRNSTTGSVRASDNKEAAAKATAEHEKKYQKT